MSTRGRASGSGLRPVGFRRWWEPTSWRGASSSIFSNPSRFSKLASSCSVSCNSSAGSFSAF